jgi:ubiquinone/menaquinone biosynthesis C-methylase UbiE
MKDNQDYRISHTSPEKGKLYDANFKKLAYRAYVWSWEKMVLTDILSFYFNNKPIKYLDFACGTGRIIGYLEPMVNEAIGVDVSDSMLEVGKQNVKKAELIKVDLTKELIFKEDYFDLITAFRFFLNAQQELRMDVFRILAKLLSQDGCFVFNIHCNSNSPLATLLRFNHWIKRRPGKLNSLELNDVRRMLTENGLRIDNIYHFGILPVIKENFTIPKKYIELIEAPASRMKAFAGISSQLIIVCRRV